jgi:hypothetical protein
VDPVVVSQFEFAGYGVKARDVPGYGHAKRQRDHDPGGVNYMELDKVFADFKDVTAQYELKRTLEVVVNGKTYRLEVLYCYSNPRARWVVYAYTHNLSGWKQLPNSEWVQNRDQKSAIRSALEFLEGRESN